MEQYNQLPKHIAIVMDGNGRWAKRRLMQRIAGHRVGAKAVRSAIAYCVEHQIEVLTLFALSVENFLNRPQAEVRFLLSLFSDLLVTEINQLHEKNISLRVIGDLQVFHEDLQKQIADAEKLTAANTGLKLVIAANYSGRWDLFQAAQAMAQEAISKGIDPNTLTESDFSKHLCLSDLPEPDLFIRTSGEHRLSNFLLWQLAYTELYFIDEYWPDFDEQVFTRAIHSFQHRERRFGCTGDQLALRISHAEN